MHTTSFVPALDSINSEITFIDGENTFVTVVGVIFSIDYM